MEQRKRLYILFGFIVSAVIVGGYWWNTSQNVQNAKPNAETAAVVSSYEKPTKEVAGEQKKTETVKVLPLQDVLAMNFEGTKTYIVAGSVNGTKSGNAWTAKIRSGGEGKISQVEFKQDGQKLMTRNDGGEWRSMDEMDRTLFYKIMEILDEK